MAARQTSLYFNPHPVEVWEAESAQLARPEDVTVTAAGDLMAVANSRTDSINIYARLNAHATGYDKAPRFVLNDARYLQFVHGVDFSPDGRFLAAAARDSHTLAIFRREGESCRFHKEPAWMAVGAENGLSFPSGVAFHPTGRHIVACNRDGDPSITCFDRVPEHDCLYACNPAKSIARETLVRSGLAHPHGLIYTPDGAQLLACHTASPKSDDRIGEPGISVFDWDERTNRLRIDEPALVYRLEDPRDRRCHSIAIHPTTGLVALTDHRFGSAFFRFSRDPFRLEPVERLPHPFAPSDPNHKRGPKGVEFTPDGTRLELTIADGQLFVYELNAGGPSGQPFPARRPRHPM